MNKKLIKKYKAEFEHWLNGGNVQAFYIKDDEPKWITDEECIEYEGNDNFSHIMQNSLEPDDVLIIIDDEYVQFRSALIEGKTVQYNFGNYGINRKDFPNTWKDLDPSIGILSDRSCPENYRIKPDMPKFKVGDWVVHNGVIKQVTKAVDGLIDSLDNQVAVIMKDESLELWEPKDGDLCWFWNNSNIYPKIATFTNKSLGMYYADISNDGFDFCEPYLPRLPSSLKHAITDNEKDSI